MGLFGKQAKEEEFISLDAPEYTETPSLPALRNTIIADGVKVTGTISGEGVVQVEGAVEGEIDTKGVVMIAATGLVRGPITADTVRIAGRVEGVITARDHLFLEKSGSVEGDVSTLSLVIEDGGRLNGRSSMLGGDKK